MATIDIRDEKAESIECIKFADYDPLEVFDHNADQIRRLADNVFIEVSTDTDNRFLFIRSKEDAQNLIKGLQKAIELDWWQDKPIGVAK